MSISRQQMNVCDNMLIRIDKGLVGNVRTGIKNEC